MTLKNTPKRNLIGALILSAITFISSNPQAEGAPIRLHPDNGHYFLFRERPTTLVGSSEHYGALINLDFDYIRYLNEVQACGLNNVRVFAGSYRETTGSFGITDNTLAPPANRTILPWKRSTVGGAGDGGNKFDLTQFDPAYFLRLKDFVQAAGQRDIVVELTYFCPYYDDSLWSISPMKSTNHINGAGAGGRVNCFQANNDLVPYQQALVRKCATELRDFDNVYYEIINEPYNGSVAAGWQNQIISELVATEAGFPARHLIAQNVANYDASIQNANSSVSIFNFHYAVPNAASQNYGLNRALGDDETGFAGTQDFPYRREAWEFMLSGGGLFNHLDFSFTASSEDGHSTVSAPGGGGPAIRKQLGVMRKFLEGMPLVRITPQNGLVAGGVPSGGAAKAIGVAGGPYGIYLRGGTQANLSLNLPAGTWQSDWIDTRSGLTVKSESFTHNSGQKTIASPGYSEDIALRLSPPSQYALKIASSPASGVAVGASPADTNGVGNGITGFTRSYSNGATVTLSAPATSGGNSFQKWQKDGVDFSTNATTSVRMNGNLTLTAVFSSSPALAEQVSNGSFESGLTGWLQSGNLLLQSTAPHTASDGTNLVAFNGGNSTPNGMLTQSVNTVSGKTYTLEFDLGVLSYNTSEQTMNVKVVGSSTLLSQTLKTTGTGDGIAKWTSHRFNFVANSAVTQLTFTDQSTSTSAIDQLLDGVSVTVGSAQTSPWITGIPGEHKIVMNAAVAGTYVLERSADLNIWSYHSEKQVAAPGLIEFTDASAPKQQMFYRIGLRN